MKYLLPLFLFLLALVACAPEEVPPTAVSLSPTNPPAATAPATPAEAEEATTVTELIMGRTAEGAFYMGNPDAPVKMLDYSNFL